MGGKMFKRRLVHSVAAGIVTLKNFIPLLKSFIANVLKCKAHVKTTSKNQALCELCMHVNQLKHC